LDAALAVSGRGWPEGHTVIHLLSTVTLLRIGELAGVRTPAVVRAASQGRQNVSVAPSAPLSYDGTPSGALTAAGAGSILGSLSSAGRPSPGSAALLTLSLTALAVWLYLRQAAQMIPKGVVLSNLVPPG
jgi:hypothetical protein